jgi:hypothetical protein
VTARTGACGHTNCAPVLIDFAPVDNSEPRPSAPQSRDSGVVSKTQHLQRLPQSAPVLRQFYSSEVAPVPQLPQYTLVYGA